MSKRPEYKFGDRVSLVTDPNKAPRIVTGINLRPGSTIYIVACGTEGETGHYSVELEPYVTDRKEAGFKK